MSTAWAKELRPCIGRFDTVKPNRLELAALTGLPTDTEEDIVRACGALRDAGVRRVFVSLGKDGMLYCGAEGVLRGRSRPLPAMVNAAGAGDAALAAIVYATRRGCDARETLNAAMAAGMLAAGSPDTISRELSPAAIEKTIKEYIL